MPSNRRSHARIIASLARPVLCMLVGIRGILLVALAAQLSLAACAIPERLLAVPKALTTQAKITQAKVSEAANIRFWVNQDPEPFVREGLAALHKEQDYLARTGHAGPLPPVSFLAISGGSDNGAFGAGLLNGWTAAGNRPEFKVVTGVSTGALIAPMAFLGSDYDAELKKPTRPSRRRTSTKSGDFSPHFSTMA